ncbi:hypothetical protein E4U43_002249 [Claviceps pusilla]|uniref:Uncharacterized protein n=1 Tax=Claviceps pusilla TaxID=123648 RepID=A0A9P7N6I0_9HYPO|nr:hypothetical protein E4U43_002249 [Claviceps pusilla]
MPRLSTIQDQEHTTSGGEFWTGGTTCRPERMQTGKTRQIGLVRFCVYPFSTCRGFWLADKNKILASPASPGLRGQNGAGLARIVRSFPNPTQPSQYLP